VKGFDQDTAQDLGADQWSSGVSDLEAHGESGLRLRLVPALQCSQTLTALTAGAALVRRELSGKRRTVPGRTCAPPVIAGAEDPPPEARLWMEGATR
jgi:hypothetical protein